MTTGQILNFRLLLKSMVLISFLTITSVNAETGVSVNCKISPAGSFKAKTKSVTGSVTIKNNEVTAEKITVDLKSLTTDMGLRDDHMKKKYLEVDKYPEATLTLGKGKAGKGEGKLKFRGIEKEIKGTYKVIDNKEVEAQFDLNMADFKISGIRYMSMGVKDIVNVTVTVPVKK
ncbi:MAG: YceI family protein [Deltaproteobacteria bacterium]|jgi:polyisoprenoid-binding protein YceI|nr:YceI family protein [Deltaproteobacteria bacterium]